MKVTVMFLVLLCVLLFGNLVSAEEQPGIVRAKIAMQIRSGDESRQAKSTDRLKDGDQLVIYIQPEPNPAYIYVLHSSDQDAVSWLNDGVQYKVFLNNVLRIPEKGFIIVDAKNSLEEIMVLCSPTELSELETLLKEGELSYEEWAKYQQSFKIDLSEALGATLNLAGTVRPLPDTFWIEEEEKMAIKQFSGNSLVIAHYTFNILQKKQDDAEGE